MARTLRELFKLLPTKTAYLNACREAKKQNEILDIPTYNKTDKTSGALLQTIVWESTRQGYNYWFNHHQKQAKKNN